MTRRGSRDGTHFRKKLLNADGPVERILILLVIAVVAGVTIGLLMPKANPTVGEITGEYTASGSAAQTLQQLTVDPVGVGLRSLGVNTCGDKLFSKKTVTLIDFLGCFLS